MEIKSHPSRVRGLKYLLDELKEFPAIVAPLAGAWIEIILEAKTSSIGSGRTPRGCVD